MAAPHWFSREAVAAFRLGLADQAVFYQIADNLDARGSSRTATSLIVERTGMSRSTAVASLGRLLRHGLIVELVTKRNGSIMRYGIPEAMPVPDIHGATRAGKHR